MALKDCTFFVDVNGKQVEMDYDQFRAYLLDGTNLSALAPTLVTKKGTKVGFERAEAAPARAEASTAKGEAKAQKGEAKAQKGEAAPEKGEAPTKKKEEKAAPEAKELPPNAPRPVTVENLRLTMGLNKSQAEAVMAVYKAMGLSLPKIRLAKGVEASGKELKQEVGKNTFLQKWKATRLMPVRMAVTLLGENLPDHIQAVAEFMMQQRDRFMNGKFGVRDIAKAYIITVSSIQARSQHIAGFEAKTGLKIPKEFLVYNAKGEPMIRPEDAVGYWLLTPQGKKALDSLEATGKVNQRLWKPLIDMRQVFGNNTLRQVLTADPASTAGQYNLNQIREITDIIKGTKGDVKALDQAVRSFRGIAEAKSGFIQHLLGFGSTATVDAREINYWVTGQKDIGQLTTPASEMARAAKEAKGADYKAVTSRIQRQIDRVASNYNLDPNVAAHVIHHWLWDATEGTATTHEGMMKAQRLAQETQEESGLVRGSIYFNSKAEQAQMDGVLAVIRGFSAANVTTPIHEAAHFYRRFMLNVENGFTPEEIKAAEDWAGARNGNWSVAAEEKWARGFERYLRSGEAPLPSLTKLFEKLAKWFQNIYKTVIGSEIDVEITPEIRRVFDRIFELQTQKAQSTEGASTLKQEARTREAEGDVARPVWRSNIIEALKSWPQSKGTPAQFMAHLKNVKGATEEAKWVDLKSFLEGKASVTRAQVEEFIAKNPLVVDMVTIPESKADPKHLMVRIKGGIDYRDVVITMPRQHQYTSAHFPEAPSYVAHMRVSSFTSKDGRKIFLVDELQSDLHQGARRYGYVTPQQREAAIKDRERAATYEREAEKARTLANEYTAYLSDNLDKPFNEWTGIRSEADATLQALRAGKPFPSTPLTAAISKAGLDDAFQRLIGLQKHADKMQKLADETTPADFWRIARMAYPETPWKETAEWVTMAFKRAVRMAVDEGADVIAWTPGNVHAGRWGAKLHKFYDKILPQTLAKFVRQWGGKVETVTFDEPEFEVPLEWELVPEQQAQLDELNEQLQEAYEAEPFNEDVVKNLEDDIELFTLGATPIEVPTGEVKERTFPSISITPQMKAEAQKGFTLFQAEGSGADSTAKARAEAIRQNRERMQARREQAGGDTSKQQKGGGTTQQQKGGPSAPRQGRTRSKPQTLSDMLRIAEEQVQAAAEREPQTDTEKRQAQAQRAVMALLRDYVRLKAQGNLPDTYTKADGTQVNREAELFDALTVMLNSATDPNDDARKATRKALSARFDEILPGRVKSKAGQPKTLQDMLREAERNVRGAAGKKVLSAQEKAQERADQEIKYLIREYAQKMYAGRLTDDLELPDGTTVSREQELLDALDALRDALKIPKEGLRLKARADAMRRVDFALLAPPLETRKQPLNIRNLLTGHAGWGRLTVRSPLSYLNYIGSYERIAGTTGRLVSDTFNEVRTRFARGQYRNFNSALADLRIQLRPLKQQLIDEGYGGLPEVIDAHVQRIEESSRNLGELSVANVKKAWQNGDLNLAANLVSSILKAFVFNAKLRLNPKSIGLNYLQPLFTLYPYFTSEEMVRLYKDSLNPDTRARVRDIAIAESGGRFTLEMQQGQTSRIPNPFTAASEQVRIMGHLAGEMLADRLKLPEGIERDMYIRSWAEKAEFDNSPWNAGPLFTGPIASVVLQFKPYMVKNLERFITDVKKNPVIGERISEKKQRITARRAKVLLVQAGIGGLSSLLTLAPPLRILAGPIMLGLLAKFIGGLADDEEVGERMAEAIYFGVPSAFALDLSSSVGFIEEPFGRSPADKFASALGPAVSMAYQGYTQADDIYELATRPQKVGESEAVKKELGERTWKLGKALTPYTRMVEAGYSLATGTRPEMFLDKETPLTTGETVGRLFGLSPVRQASYYEMKEAPDLAKRIVGMQPDIAGIPRERGETDKTYRVKVQRVTEWRDSYGKQLENHPRFKTLDKATKDKALEIINGNISAEAAKVKPNLGNLRPEYVIRRAKESIRQAPRRAKRQMYVPPPED